jgi:UDP-3-O-[3-hydroxymyristoyl] glucosamine N-acyltransferase
MSQHVRSPVHLAQVREWLDASIVRDGAFESLGFVSHASARMLVFLESERFLRGAVENPNVSCIVAGPELATGVPGHLGLAVTPDPRRAFYRLQEQLVRHSAFYGTPVRTSVAPSARIHPSSVIADDGVRIGEQAVIDPHVTIHPGVVIEDEAVIRAGTVLGSEGFQVQVFEGRPMRVPHGGSVRIGRGADVHANCCIDRGLFGGETLVGEDTTLDSLVYVAHDAQLGRLCRVGAGAVINGSCLVGDEAWIGPNATISSEIRVGAGAWISLGSVVTRDVPPGQRVSGNFAIAHDRFLDHLRRIR